MRIVINALQFKPNSSGIGVLIRDLFGLFVLRTAFPCQVVLSANAPDFSAGNSTEIVRASFDHRQNVRRMWFQTVTLGTLCKDAVLLTTDSKLPLFLPKSCRVLPVITDLAVYRMGSVYKLSRALWWRLQYRYLRSRAERYLAISEFTKSELVSVFHLPPEKIDVVPCACGESMRRVKDAALLDAVRARYALPEQFLLFVGNANPRKNLDRVLRAFDTARSAGDFPYKLVIAGEQGWKFDRVAALAPLAHREDVLFTGFVPDEDLPALYTLASLFVFPTLYEGFGLPVLEAQRCGVPVLTANTSSLPEVGGDGCFYVNPLDEAEICAGMRQVLLTPDLAAELTNRGTENAARYSWTRSASLLENIIAEEMAK